MASFLRHIPALLAFALALVSFVFSVVGITSKEWVVRNNYNRSLNIIDWDEPLYRLYRSPFLICSASLMNSTNATVEYSSDCERWKPFGKGRTSCESTNATGNDTASNLGDTRLCQQIHFAGNFAIASTAFLGLATVLSLAMTVLHLFKANLVEDEFEHSRSRVRHSKHQVVEETHHIGPSNTTTSKDGPRQSIVIGSYVSFFGLVCFAVATIAAVIAQFYAILGLTMSLPNNSDFSSSAISSLDDVNTQGSHGPWYQGKALSTYWTCAWGFALGAGMMASRVWILPRWKR